MRRSSISVSHYAIDSAVLGNTRSVWIQPPLGGGVESGVGAVGVAIFLDGEYYLTHFRAPQVMHSLQAERAIPPMWCVYVDAREREVRWPESLCNPDFATFLCDELVPQVEALTGCSTQRMIAGLSLTGLSAAYVALSRPGSFQRVLCHTASFWWERGTLSTRIGEWAHSDTVFRITVGDKETATDVDHGHGLVQIDSQVDGCRQMRDALKAHGYSVSYAEYDGGHDIPSIRRDLPEDLRILYI